MAIKTFDLLQEDALTQLTRAELQTLGKAHNVKANLKSATIISHLLKKFPDGVPNPSTNSAPAPRRKGQTIKRGPMRNTRIKKEESVVASGLSSNGDNSLQPDERRDPASASHQSAVADNLIIEPISQATPTRKYTTRAASRARPSIEEPSRPTNPVQSLARTSPISTEIVEYPVPTEIVASPVQAEPAVQRSPLTVPHTQSEQETGEGYESGGAVHTAGEGEVDMDNLSDVSEMTHNPSVSSRGASPQPLANDATLKYVVDIIKANAEKDKQMRGEIKSLQERAAKAKTLLQEQHYLLNAEREHRQRIISFLLYHIRNNNRWIGQSVNTKQVDANFLEKMVTNEGRGWKDMGEWEYGELWTGPMVVSNSNIELTASNLEEYLRDMWDIHQRERQEGNMKPTDSSTGSAPPPAASSDAPVAPANPAIDSIDAPTSLSRKRKIITTPDLLPPALEVEDRPAAKRQRLSPIPEGSLMAHPASSSPPLPRKNKGKGRMSTLEVEQLQREQAREERVRSMKELDEDDSADAYEIQVALADSLLQSAGQIAMDQ